MTDAPVCHIPVETPIQQPNSPTLPAIPLATDLSSALAAINAMRRILQTLLNQNSNRGTGKARVGRWTEAGRSKSKVKVYNPNDHDQFVEVERINSLTMRDSVTGELWTWKR